MSPRIKWLIACGLLVALCFFARKRTVKSENVSIEVREKLTHLTKDRFKARLHEHSRVSTPHAKEEGLTTEVRSVFQALFDVRDSLGAEDIRNEVFAQFSRRDDIIAVIQNTLIDETWAKKSFRDQHGVARVLGVQFLSYLAKNGNDRVLIDTTSQLYSRLKTNRTLSQGQLLDMEDLTRELSLNSKNVEHPEELVASFLHEIGFSPEEEFASAALRDALIVGLAMGMKGRFQWQSIESALEVLEVEPNYRI